MQQRLNAGLDFCRIAACFMVVLLHIASAGAMQLDDNWMSSNIYNSLVRSCVPLFLMLSGALLLNRTESAVTFYQKRFLRILPPLLFWSAFYALWRASMGAGHGSLWQATVAILQGPVYYHLWYLYAIIGIYLFMPFMAKVYQHSGLQEKRVFLGVWLVISCLLPTAAQFNPALANMVHTYELFAFMGFAGYAFLGAYIYEQIRLHGPGNIWANLGGFALTGALTAAATHTMSMQQGEPSQVFYSYVSPLVVLAAICAFRLLLALGGRLVRHSKLLAELSGCTLGLYCLHVFIMNRASVFYGPLIEGHSLVWLIPSLALAVFLLTLIPIYLVRLLKPVRAVI
ncbi:MAG: acyltransferase family protein [Candidatus Pseudomonas phytovorans]|uniref:Acyltransferase family protein n=1 Tax=Candidatus Pseudomonas phytovorans TaxID=3121377 RepID=A0AAJ5WJB7_9PSED|nr:acyltransferase family protein [Pseudomonas sp.]WEK29760.1 MAG: acyltransferase family protein [Pseudomonas sp.]